MLFRSGGMHLVKSGTRAILNTSPEPFSNWTASATEDAVLPVGLWLAVAKPAIFFAFLALQALVALLLLAWIVKGLSLWLRRLRARGS